MNAVNPLSARLQDHLPSLSRPLAQLTRHLFGVRAGALAARQALAILPAPASRFHRPVRLCLLCDDGAIDLVIDAGYRPALESAALAADAELRAALAQSLLAPLFESLREAGGPSLAVRALDPADQGADDGCDNTNKNRRHDIFGDSARPDGIGAGIGAGVSARCRAGDADDDASLALPIRFTAIDAAALNALARCLDGAAGSQSDLHHYHHHGEDSGAGQDHDHDHDLDQASADAAMRLGALRLPTRLRIGERRCSEALLRSLRPGDVLLNWQGGDATATTLARVQLCWGASRAVQCRVAARVDHSILTIEGYPGMHTEHPYHSSHDDDGADHAPAVSLAALDLPVALELAVMVLPLDQIGGLQPGQVLELPLPLAETEIRLVVYGQTLGYGRLLMVGEHLGLQISRMAEPHEPDA